MSSNMRSKQYKIYNQNIKNILQFRFTPQSLQFSGSAKIGFFCRNVTNATPNYTRMAHIHKEI